MENYTSLIVLFAFAVVLLIFVAMRLAMFLQWFRRELRYLNKEIARTYGDEQKHWKKRRKRLWWSLIPFVRY